jgi:hypothetical protein
MALHGRLLGLLAIGMIMAYACTRPVLIGSDFLDDEKANLDFTDSFDLDFITERTDRLLVHSDNVSNQLITYSLGITNDPIFGQTKTEIFAQPLLPTIGTGLIQSTFDSIVLQLYYDTLGNYGDITAPVTIEVYRMTERPDYTREYYSDEKFMTEPDVLGSLTFVPQPFDSVTIQSASDTVVLPPHIRVQLSKIKMGELLLQDSSVFSNQDSFLNFFNGLNIRMTNATNTMLGIDILASEMSIFYDKADVMDREFKFIFTSGSVKTVSMEHDYTGSLAASAIEDTLPENDYWYVQGLSGLTTRLRINDLSSLGNIIINQAELEVYSTHPPGDDAHLFPPVQYLVTQNKTDTSFVNSIDASIGLSRAAGDVSSPLYDLLYGGVIEEVSAGPPPVYKYDVKVTSQVKDILQGKQKNIIYFNPFDKGNVPNRSVMIGPGHPTYAPRLRIYYTVL